MRDVIVSASIMAHPDRIDRVRDLQERLGRPTPVAWDREGPPSRDPNRIWRTARAAWELRDPGADWHLLLQDDAIPAPGLLDALPGMLVHTPTMAVVSLYLGTGRPVPGVWHSLGRRADEAGASWIVGPRSMWGVALALPTSMIGDMLTWCDRQPGIPDDMRVGKWAQRAGLEAWFPWPCLVDHVDNSSLIGHGAGRKARRYSGQDARTVAWDGPIVRWQR